MVTQSSEQGNQQGGAAGRFEYQMLKDLLLTRFSKTKASLKMSTHTAVTLLKNHCVLILKPLQMQDMVSIKHQHTKFLPLALLQIKQSH